MRTFLAWLEGGTTRALRMARAPLSPEVKGPAKDLGAGEVASAESDKESTGTVQFCRKSRSRRCRLGFTRLC